MTSTMTSQSNRPEKIILLTRVIQMTLRRLREYARAEGVLVKLRVALESTSDLSRKTECQKQQSTARNFRVILHGLT
jgi:hypothetical protein